MSTAIKVENLSKIYRLGEIGTGTISRDMERWFKKKILKQEDPFLKIGEINDRAKKGTNNIVYSLQDINFEINQGDTVGIIGRNGAGKSTLLKLLSRVTTPTEGKINIKGRVASLLEVGTGFHPELTGRENIYLNGAILGMRKKEIDKKLDTIIDFSGVERYIDTPVKRYSSGMYVRLAFAVAAHLESEILIVDEVLAVGDAEFQRKCLGKMTDVSKNDGRTVLFVSHNLEAIKSLCVKGITLFNGKIDYYGYSTVAVEKYLSHNSKSMNIYTNRNVDVSQNAQIVGVTLASNDTEDQVFYIEHDLLITLEILVTKDDSIISSSIHVLGMGSLVFILGDSPKKLSKGNYKISYKIPKHQLNTIHYSIDVYLMTEISNVCHSVLGVIEFKLEEKCRTIEYLGAIGGLMRPKYSEAVCLSLEVES